MADSTAVLRPVTREDLALLDSREVNANSGFARRNLALADAGDSVFLGAFSSDDIMGYVVLDCREGELRPEMKSLWVYPQYRRRGLGVALTAEIERIAAERGFSSVKLGVDPENFAAIPMYIGLGYTPTGDHREVTDADGAASHEAIFRKSLTMR